MYLKPSPGCTVPDPDRKDNLPTAGRAVQPSTYWQRRLDCGDVVEVDAPPADDVQTSALADQ